MKNRNWIHRLICCVIGILAPIFALAQASPTPPPEPPEPRFQPDLNTTPFHIVNKLSGLCIQQYETTYKDIVQDKVRESLLFRTATCSDTDPAQKFYVLQAAAENPYIPEIDGSGVPIRIVGGGNYELRSRRWFNLNSDNVYGSRVFNFYDNIEYPATGDAGRNALWMFIRAAVSQTLLNNQFEGLLLNGSTHHCLSYENHNTAVGTPITVGECQNQDVWRLEPTTYFYSTIQPQ